mmetsp:Transcript_22123/g.44759  ORF Transcript_22123/g.44759 Transcript_22123/m.44759 type:complete len:258 (+) Transcript_22123:361-1134(+)
MSAPFSPLESVSLSSTVSLSPGLPCGLPFPAFAMPSSTYSAAPSSSGATEMRRSDSPSAAVSTRASEFSSTSSVSKRPVAPASKRRASPWRLSHTRSPFCTSTDANCTSTTPCPAVSTKSRSVSRIRTLRSLTGMHASWSVSCTSKSHAVTRTSGKASSKLALTTSAMMSLACTSYCTSCMSALFVASILLSCTDISSFLPLGVLRSAPIASLLRRTLSLLSPVSSTSPSSPSENGTRGSLRGFVALSVMFHGKLHT